MDVAIDYPDQDIEYITHSEVENRLNEVILDLKNLDKTTKTGQIIKNGIRPRTKTAEAKGLTLESVEY